MNCRNELRVVRKNLRVFVAEIGAIGILIDEHLILTLGLGPAAVPTQNARVLNSGVGVVRPQFEVALVKTDRLVVRFDARVRLRQREDVVGILRR